FGRDDRWIFWRLARLDLDAPHRHHAGAPWNSPRDALRHCPRVKHKIAYTGNWTSHLARHGTGNTVTGIASSTASVRRGRRRTWMLLVSNAERAHLSKRAWPHHCAGNIRHPVGHVHRSPPQL